MNEINNGISELSILNFKSIDLQYNDLESALNDTHKSNVCGNDGISSYMILNSNISFIKTIILQFFKHIFKNSSYIHFQVTFRIISMCHILFLLLLKIKINLHQM